MRILHVIDSLAVGGAERMLVDIANAAADDGHQVSVCVTRSAADLSRDLRPEITLAALDRHRRFDIGAMRRFSDFVRHRADVLHIHGRTSMAFVTAVQTLGWAKVPVVFHDHFGSIEVDRSVPHWFRLRGKQHMAQYVGVSESLATWAASAGIPPDHIKVINNAVDQRRLDEARLPRPQSLREEFAVPDNALLGVAVAGIRHVKGIDVLLKAVAQSQVREMARIIVIGGEREPDYAAACRAQCHTLGLSEKVRFAGERPDISPLLSEADFALLPSRSESGPLVVIEYMLAGLPFVASKVGGVAARASSLGLEEFVQVGDASKFAMAIDRLVNLSSDQRHARGEAGKLAARTHFDIRHVMPRWYDVYSAALSS